MSIWNVLIFLYFDINILYIINSFNNDKLMISRTFKLHVTSEALFSWSRIKIKGRIYLNPAYYYTKIIWADNLILRVKQPLTLILKIKYLPYKTSITYISCDESLTVSVVNSEGLLQLLLHLFLIVLAHEPGGHCCEHGQAELATSLLVNLIIFFVNFIFIFLLYYNYNYNCLKPQICLFSSIFSKIFLTV